MKRHQSGRGQKSLPLSTVQLNTMKDHVKRLADSGIKHVYIAIIPDLQDYYGLEVEVSDGEIGLTWDTSTQSLGLARKQADVLDDLLSEADINVCLTREEWEANNESS